MTNKQQEAIAEVNNRIATPLSDEEKKRIRKDVRAHLLQHSPFFAEAQKEGMSVLQYGRTVAERMGVEEASRELFADMVVRSDLFGQEECEVEFDGKYPKVVGGKLIKRDARRTAVIEDEPETLTQGE